MGQVPQLISNEKKIGDIAKDYQHLLKYPIIQAKVNNELQELHKTLVEDCEIQFIDITHPQGMKVYQRSLSLVMIYAVKTLIGKKAKVVIEHSINKNLYCEILENNFVLTDEFVQQLENTMNTIIKKNLPIQKVNIPIEEAIKIADDFGMGDKTKILKYRRVSTVNFYRLDWFYDYFYGHMAENTGCLSKFKLMKTGNGFLIMFPSMANPDIIPEYKPLTKISAVFKESSNWGKIMRVDTVGALNDIICQGKLGDLIRISEALQEKKIAQMADLISEKKDKIKIVLIAGPSSSGKTTFAERLCIQLRASGVKPFIISLDNYFTNIADRPLDESGNPVFEDLEAVNVPLFNKDMSSLLEGKTIQIPTFNFIKGESEYRGNFLRLEEDTVLVVEGIHGLNEKLSESIPHENKFKIFISALTQLSIDDHNRIPTSDSRLIRRIVRDNQFRGKDAASTIDLWNPVMAGEAKNIFPFQEEADAMFNSALVYEMCILKQYVEPLLFKIDKSMSQYTEARRLIKFMDYFLSAPSEDVPRISIMREFIGGSCFNT